MVLSTNSLSPERPIRYPVPCPQSDPRFKSSLILNPSNCQIEARFINASPLKANFTIHHVDWQGKELYLKSLLVGEIYPLRHVCVGHGYRVYHDNLLVMQKQISTTEVMENQVEILVNGCRGMKGLHPPYDWMIGTTGAFFQLEVGNLDHVINDLEVREAV
jgi:hypothetical protein